ncbi:MAG: sugar ABC transporter ATP-binding protein [Candidatus Limiplasma sp.]|nr:sugar ABC transporter ATP-binding protein [Candidatus Limiplasma sp.]
MSYALEMRGIHKSFAGLRALCGAHLAVGQGEAHALLGINGAGKSTMIKILSGVYTRDAGEILIGGEPRQINTPKDAIACGISAVYQDPQMIESYTGYENIYLGHEGAGEAALSAVNRRRLRKQAQELVARYPFEIDVEKPVYLMSSVEREIIAILRALSKECRILVLDEPTSILTEKEKYTLFEFIHILKRTGVSIIYITHHLDEVAQVCDSFSVFRNGCNVCREEIHGGAVDSGHIAELMLGERLDQIYPPRAPEPSEDVCLTASGLSLEGRFQDISFQARRGEVFGVFGLVGSGIDELSKVLVGAVRETAGTLEKDGKRLALSSPGAAIRHGLYLVPGNRKTEGLLHNLPITFNVTIAKLEKAVRRLNIVDRRLEARSAQELAEKLSISTPSVQKKVNELSGGNQQKVVIAKGLYTEADVYIFCEPTVGVDVGAKSGIYEMIRKLARKAAVLIISSEPEEVLGNADRVMVIYQGRTTLRKSAAGTTLKEMLVHAISNGEVEA